MYNKKIDNMIKKNKNGAKYITFDIKSNQPLAGVDNKITNSIKIRKY
jgi:hypothetical protein